MSPVNARASAGVALLAGAILFSVALSASGSPADAVSWPMVAIDVGHTLRAPGATSARGTSEFTFNRRLADAVLRHTRATGLRASLINANGRIGGLTDRTALAAREGADFFLSIHHDSVQPQFLAPWSVDGTGRLRSAGRHGFSLFVSRRNRDSAGSLRCASFLGQELRKAGFTPSRYHAEPIAGEDRPFADEANGVHFYDGLAVLRTSASPAVLLEAGVITDAEEELMLERTATREAIARAIAAGLRSCLVDGAQKQDAVGVSEGN